MVVKVEAEPAEVTASDFLNINLTVSPPATSIYFFQLYISIEILHRFQAKKRLLVPLSENRVVEEYSGKAS